MSNTIRIKRRLSGSAGAPGLLENAEIAFNEVDDVLYYGKGVGGAGGSATAILAIGGPGAFLTLSGTQSVSGNKTFTGSINMGGATSVSVPTQANGDNTTKAASTAFVQSALSGYLPTTGGTISSSLVISGNLTVQGTTTTVNSTQVDVADKNITLGNVAIPSDVTADGGGITLLGSSAKEIKWVSSTNSWTFSDHVNLASGKSFFIDGTSVLSSTSLGSGVTSSSLTSVGTISTGVWQGTKIGVSYGGTGATNATDARANLGLAIGTNVQAYDEDLTTLSGMQSGAPTALALLTSTEIAALDGSTSATMTTLATSDRLVVNDSGSVVQVALSDLVTFLEDGVTSGFDVDGGSF